MAQKNVSNNTVLPSNKSIYEMVITTDGSGNPMTSGAFLPSGNTVTFLANTAAPTPVQCIVTSNTNYVQYRIFNSGSSLVFLGTGNTAVTANTNAVIVTTSANSIPVLPGSLEVITFNSNAYFTGITASGNSQVYITPGSGI